MSPRKKKNSDTAETRLTDVELELMNILWKKGEGGVHDVMEALPKDRDLAYTSVSTVLRILEQKGFLRARKEGRGHIYIPVIAKAKYESVAINHLVQQVFDNTPGSLLRRLVETRGMNPEDLAELRRELDLLSKENQS